MIEEFDGTFFSLKGYYNCSKIIGVGGFAFVVEA